MTGLTRKYVRKPFTTKDKRICKECGTEYYGLGNQKYCSILCSQRNDYKSNMLKPKWRIGKLLAAAKNRATSKGLDFNLTADYLEKLWESTFGCCILTGRPFDLSKFGEHGQVNPNAPSIDRITPSLGYVEGNVRFIAYQVNVGISEFGFETFLKLCKDVVEFNKD